MNMKEQLKYVPIGICGTAMAFMTLSNGWNFRGLGFLRPIAIAFALSVLVLKLSKIIMHPKQIREELAHPVTGSFYPTIDMMCFLIAAYFLPMAPTFARILWLSAIVVHFIIMGIFIYHRSKCIAFEDVVPSWFIIMIGMVVAVVTSPGMGFDSLAKGLFIFGCTWYVVMWPMMMYRVFKTGLAEGHKPNIGIMAAPGSLCLAGYLTAFDQINIYLVAFLCMTAMVNLFIVYIRIPSFIQAGFKASYAAFTFPLAISAFAMYKMSVYHKVFLVIGDIEIFIATGVIFYVMYHFISQFVKAIKEHMNHSNKQVREAKSIITK